MNIDIKRIDADNFQDFIQLIGEFAQYEKLNGPDNEAIARLRSDGLDNDPRYNAYLAYDKNHPIGFIVYSFTYSTFLAKPTLFIEDIYIRKEFRRQGLGKHLFGFCVESAKRFGCGRIDLAVLDWNSSAISFYEDLGAEKLPWFSYRLSEDTMNDFRLS